MPLRLTNPSLEEAKIDIVAIPPIGADPDTTWRYPGSPESPSLDDKLLIQLSNTLFRDVPQARIYHYSYPIRPDWLSTTVDSYAWDLLEHLHANRSIGKRPLHMVAHSTGGLVLKSAMVLARIRKSEKKNEVLLSSCIGVAFFGVPHYGSAYFSLAQYHFNDPEIMKLVGPASLGNKDMSFEENSALLNDLNQKFYLVALGLPKIWTFVETETTTVIPIESRKGRAPTAKQTLVVQPWSATLSTDDMRVGTESVTQISSNHARLCRFGDDPDHPEFKRYINRLNFYVSNLSTYDLSVDRTKLENRVMVDFHVFYGGDAESGTTSIKVIPDQTSLKNLLDNSPNACIQDKVNLHMGEVREEEHQKSVSRQQAVPSLVITTEEGEQTWISQKDDFDRPHKDGFDKPISWELADSGFEREADTPSSRSLSSRSSNESLRLGTTPGDEASPLDPLKAPAQRLSRDPERFPVRSDRKSLEQILPGYRFSWIHVPANNMSWVPAVFDGVGKDSGETLLSRSLLHSESWTSRQYEALHGFPHGRYMRPGCGAFFPKGHRPPKWRNENLPERLASPIDSMQVFLYMPYLHWDSYGCLRSRNELVKERMAVKPPVPPREDILKGKSLERMLIWQHLDNAANLPYHLRRSLDQYGYPTLADMTNRDSDQIIYKWWIRSREDQEDDERKKPKKQKERKTYSGQLYKMMKDDIATVRAAAEERRENEAKVLMVDQLWCWVVDSKTIVTFFPFREDEDKTGYTSQADLRAAILKKIKGDPRYAAQCYHPYDLAALIAQHAVTEFMERSADKELEVLRIFEQYINILTERQTRSFKEFRIAHQQITLRGGIAVKPLDNSDDLGALLELRDIEDELKILYKLFKEQTEVLEQLRSLYREGKDYIGSLEPEKDEEKSQQQWLGWLTHTLERLAEYRSQIELMRDSCLATQESYKSLLDMKQKQANADEAWLARQSAEVAASQSRAVMIFTIFTIIFLPLSFFTSLFGMNVREWSGEPQNLPMITVVLLMTLVSALVILGALLLAFKESVREMVIRLSYRGYQKLVEMRISLPFSKGKLGGYRGDVDLEKGEEEKLFFGRRKAKIF